MQRLPLHPPRSMRELFGLLAYYNPDRGLDDLLDLIDFRGVTPIHIYNVVLNRAPESIEFALPSERYQPRRHFRAALLSAEFRRNVLRNFLGAFPEKGRDVFIHVPKCAGTDLIFNLARRSLPIPKLLEDPGWISDADFLAALGGIARAVPFHERFFVYGHMELGEYVAAVGIRPIDHLFTIIRDPLDLMLSQANYAIGRLRQDPTGQDPDTAEMLKHLDIPRLPEPLTNQDLKDLAIRALHDPRITQPNRACLYLGIGMQMRYALAMQDLVTHNIEITTTRYYSRWLRERWGITESKQHNQSDKLLTRNEVRRFHADAMQQGMAQDQMLFDVVSWALRQSGTASITGPEIARLAGPGLLDDFPARLRAGEVKGGSGRGGGSVRDLVMAQEPENVEMYLAEPSVVLPGTPGMHKLLEVDFGQDGKGRDYLLDGWSVSERAFTWTDKRESQLQLPSLPAAGTCFLRLIGRPFVSPPELASQSIDILLDDVSVGTARISDLAVIECDIPAEVQRRHAPVTVTLRLPDATRPGELGDAKDLRLLAFALQTAAVFQVLESDGPG